VVDVPVRSELVERAARRDDTPGRSALYVGTVLHHRRGEVEHRFTQEVAMPLLDLGEVEQTMAAHPLWSARRPSLVRFRRADYLGDPSVDLAEAVRRLVTSAPARARGPDRRAHQPAGVGLAVQSHHVLLLLRPERRGRRVPGDRVTNTPWHERHTYVVGPPGTHHLDKELHVSPFFGMEQTYELRYQAPAERLSSASQSARAAAKCSRRPWRCAASHSTGRRRAAWPAPGARRPRGLGGIYRQAMALRAKVSAPPPPARPASR